ncbi:MAG: hypothetical protein K6F37_01500 [Lachnospiraceae bacterium]|nr:hypothetical protein [Lachnospiraceae bacterium]
MLDLSSERSFRWLKEEKKAYDWGEAIRFQQIDFYSGSRKINYSSLLNRNYECVILDLGKNVTDYKELFLGSDRKMIACILQKWKRKEAEITLERFQNPMWGFLLPEFYSFSYTEEERKKFEHRSGVKVRQLPLIPDPFHLTTEQVYSLTEVIDKGPD